MFSTIMIIPDPLKADANLLGAALGYGSDNYTIEIPPGGPAMYWAGHSYATDAFFAMVMAAQGGTLPPLDWPAHGLTAERVGAVMAALIISAPGSPLDPEGVPYASPTEHFAAVAASLVSEA
jgi:hypothetical protein